LIFVSATEH